MVNIVNTLKYFVYILKAKEREDRTLQRQQRRAEIIAKKQKLTEEKIAAKKLEMRKGNYVCMWFIVVLLSMLYDSMFLNLN